MQYFLNAWIKFLVLLTPFFALSMFVLYTATMAPEARARLAWKVMFAVLTIGLILFLIGNALFAVAGITIDSFRIGAGILLFLSAVSLVHGGNSIQHSGEDVAVVPLAIPIIIGPATTGAILIMGAEVNSASQRLIALASLVAAIVTIGCLLRAATWVERVIKSRGIVILSKLTGLILAALASQMVFDGIRHFLMVGAR